MKQFLKFLFFIWFTTSYAQQRYADSIRKLLVNPKNDSLKVVLLLDLANITDSREALQYALEASALAEKSGTEKHILFSLHTIGNIYCNMGDYQNGLIHYLKEMKLIEASGNTRKLPGVYNGIGNVYCAQGQYDKALENYLAGVGIIKKTFSEPDQHVLVTYYNNIGETFFLKGDYEKAIEYYSKVIDMNLSRGEVDAYTMGNAYLGIGNIYYLKKDLDKAFDLYNKSLEMFTRIQIEQCIANSEVGIAKVFEAKGKLSDAVRHYENAIALSEKNNANLVVLDAYQGLASTYAKSGEYKKAYGALEKSFRLKDTILNESKLKLMDEMEAKYETAKKDKELVLQKAELEKQQADAREKSMQRNIFIGAFLAMALLVFAVLRGYSQKKRANAEISKQKEIIEEKQKEIIDSIRYAKRIQNALITSEKYVERNLGRLNKDD